jgi:predicted DNA-binding transcriptional regulator YafY
MAKRAKLPLLTLSLSTDEEIDAVLVGLCAVELDEDSPLAPAVAALIERIVATLPPPNAPEKPRRISHASAPSNSLAEDIHAAILNEHSLRIAYSDRKGIDTRRTIWPIEFYFVGEEDGMVLAWCEAREDFRNFRTDRIRSMETLDRYPVRRQLLLARWTAQQDQENDFY